ncbi:hypothetical protein ACFLS1_11740 [Verrucomicrobiota bacterium]
MNSLVKRITILPAILYLSAAVTCSAALRQPPFSRDQLKSTTFKAIESNDWIEHRQLLDRGLVQTADNASKKGRLSFDQIISDDLTALALAQATFIRQITEDALNQVNVSFDTHPFFEWLLTNRTVLEDFLECIKDEDDKAKVLRTWFDLWESDEECYKYYNLAIACAVVFDKPLRINRNHKDYNKDTEINVQARYNYFRQAADNKTLKTSLDTLPAWELIWVVDADVPDHELEWANSHVKYSRKTWSEAYRSIKYRMDKLNKGNSIYENYTLKEIKKEGGICVDQAFFAATSAKANGIPAILFTGEGQRGGHAWFGYKSSTKEWNMNAGRYQADKFATGHALDPQTRERVKEQNFYILTDSQRRSPNYRKTSQLIWLATVVSDAYKPAKAGEILEQATEVSSRHTKAWKIYINHLTQNETPEKKMDDALRKLRSAFRKYPDMLSFANNIETENALKNSDTQTAIDILRKQIRKMTIKHGDRSDLMMEQVNKQINLLKQSGDIKGAEKVYIDTMKKHGADVTVFRRLASGYADFAKENNMLDDAVRDIYSIFRRNYTEPGDDYFEMQTYAHLLEFIADIYKKADQESKARRILKDAARIRKRMAQSQRYER